ncbi:TenA family protein [Aurantimonas sp. C2-6-R+9]|uniref:TenA family protein n=1 Tax=unclassified Aurantimonas TaxID=2638230 RepID=UPI002E177A27|nr:MULTISPECIES: TenA family protein [unclassified Aurantimonas]MEC5291154.1 TenA family protein [Aurantimonas sp. C2-3-R2]MEC5381481.1 TenA family protein [Aurantimonas sp. C2-6-R+9]MEC5411884.1 TenA family protein [Aurantimonas sp. C2-4-R8]
MTRQSLDFGDQLVADHTVLWDRMQSHRFVLDIEAGLLPAAVFCRYLVYEAEFVATAVRIFALAVAKAPTLREQTWLVGVLKALTDEQIGYFRATFDDLGIDPERYDRDDPRVTDFDRGMLEIAETGGFADIVTAMFAAEWMYWHWCTKAAQAEIADPVLKRWIDLHAAEGFADQARWLKAEVDRHGENACESERERLSRLFGNVLKLEIAFHDAAYGDG